MSGLPLPPSNVGLQTPAVQAALLKGIGQQLGGVEGLDPLKVGQVVSARIGSDPETGAPMLVLGGTRIAAELPATCRWGSCCACACRRAGRSASC